MGFLSLAACREKSTTKPDLIPGVDNIHTFETDTLGISIRTSFFDSLQTNDYSFPVVALGRIENDVFFGKTTAGVYMQVVPPGDGFSFPANTTIDSSVLSMPYAYFSFGDTISSNPAHAVHLKAYRITDPFTFDLNRRYFAFDRLAYSSLLGAGTITTKSLNDTFSLATGDTVYNKLRLKLNDAFNNIMATTDAAILGSPSAFLDYFRGIYLAPDTTLSQNTLNYVLMSGGAGNLNYSNAQVEVYYHAGSDTTLKRAFFRFQPASCSFFNGVYRNYAGSPARAYTGNTSANRDSVILQTYPGFRSDLTIRLGNSIPPSVINKAELSVTAIKTGDDTRFPPPAVMLVRVVESDGSERLVADMANADGSLNTSGQAFVGGTSVSVTVGGVQYTRYILNIPRELQQALVTGKTELKLRLSSSIAFPGSFRMIAGGTGAPDATRLRFHVIYTKLNQ